MVFLAILLGSIINSSAPDPVEAEVAWVVEGEFCEPETVLPLPDDHLLVSNVCGFSEPGSGYLSLLGSEGEVIDWRVVDGLHHRQESRSRLVILNVDLPL